jgi:hypothetical protein
LNKFRYQNFPAIERTPSSPASLQYRLTELLYNSTCCKCKVDSVNPTTGEYRIVLQGTLDYWDDTNATNNS